LKCDSLAVKRNSGVRHLPHKGDASPCKIDIAHLQKTLRRADVILEANLARHLTIPGTRGICVSA
jgi:hypothetical protein